MSPDQERRLEEIFSAARNLPAQERAAFLEQACRGNAELRRQADSLLAAHDQAGQFLQPTGVLLKPSAPAEKPGDRIGRYKLLEQIGEGGFGVVWMAEQEEPMRRRVALKIIKLGMDTKEVLARFEAERQALAMMAEKDNDKEWLPSPRQTGLRGFKVTQAQVDAWMRVLDELEAVASVKKLLAHWRLKPGVGINLDKFIASPPPLDLVLLFQGSALVPYVVVGAVSDVATWRRLTEPFGPGFA